MRSISHWTPRYVRDRVREKIWQRRNPTLPWMTPAIVPIIEGLLRPADVVFEWGAGRSTPWFAARTARITSIECQPEWFDRVQRRLADFPDSKCVLIPDDETDLAGWSERYVGALGTIEPGPVDVVVVDGLLRDLCALHAVDRLTAGGLLIIDDIHRRLPSRSRAPGARRDYGSPEWREFAFRVSTWRRIWVSSGVTDTAIWISPGGESPRP